MTDLGGFGVVAAAAILGIVIGVIIGIAVYVFFAFSLSRLAQSRNVDMPWLAWIPIAQMYIIGKLVKSVKVSNFEIPSLEIVLPAAMLVFVLLRGITVLGFLITIAFYALLLLSLYNLYKQYLPENAVAYTILSIFGIPVPFFFLKISKLNPIENA